MLYFAYGSNMALARLQQRIPSARRLGTGHLPGYQLRFHVASTKDGSAKCDAFLTGDDNDLVVGALFRLDPEAKPVLDGYEGVGVEYRDELVSVEFGGGRQEALIYVGSNLDSALRPFNWYREHVLRGALENDLPVEYVAAIREVPCVDDPDAERTLRELSIYR
ncbi:MAG: gamma-glutamylcyclotransferase [Desulfuromonas sp.]|nr:MAG: gamma-glutamylcyclotransferase [Desulfuromonas sp.]